jgi:hypothetical protein
MLVGMFCLCSCVRENYENCPIFPVAGESVGGELKNIPYNGYENFWEWLGRINKLRQELDLCN